MIDRLDREQIPVLKTFPSAQAGLAISGSAAPATKSRGLGLWRFAFRLLGTLIIISLLAIGAAIFYLSQGPVSNEQLRGQLQRQLSDFLGTGKRAEIAGAKMSIGQNGLLAIDASNVRILSDDQLNLGVAREVAVKLKALPLLKGQIEARSVDMRGASIALSPFLLGINLDSNQDWPRAIDFNAALGTLGRAFADLARSIETSGLETVSLTDTNLLGFEALGLRSVQGRLADLKIEKDKNFQSGTFFRGSLELETGVWRFSGSWKNAPAASGAGVKMLALTIDGVDVSDLIAVPDTSTQSSWVAHGGLRFDIRAPFNEDGTPQQAVLQATLSKGNFTANGELISAIEEAELNFRFLPEKNQIELERSPIRFATTSAVLIGGLRYPANEEAAAKEPPLFQLAANELKAFGLIENNERETGAANITGSLDTQARRVVANDIRLLTPSGEMTGGGSLDFAKGSPHIRFDLKIAQMSVGDFKQFWPGFVASGTREWARDGIREGEIRDAWVKGDFPPGLFGNDAAYTSDNLAAEVPVYGASVKSVGKLPRISKAEGIIDFRGKETVINLKAGELAVGRKRPVAVAESRLKLSDYTTEFQDADLALALSGDAASLALLGTMEPLAFTHDLDLEPASMSGVAKAQIEARFVLQDVEKKGLKDWSAKVQLAKLATGKPVSGRTVEGADLTIEASPKGATVAGTAKLDGVPVKLAMKGPLGNAAQMERTATLTLSDKDRARLGADMGNVLQGPISVSISGGTGDEEFVEADLKNARLNFPWVGWSKGKGIPAKASFSMRKVNGETRISDLKLSGSGFSAGGSLEFDKAGLAKAVLKRVRLNKTDDIDVTVQRGKGSYSVEFDARSYDGRSLIQSVLKAPANARRDGTAIVVQGRLNSLTGFHGQALTAVKVDFAQKGGKITRAVVKGRAGGNAPTSFALTPVSGGMQTQIATTNAGSLLQFLDLYTKVRGGSLTASLVQDGSGVFRGGVTASDFTLLDEPRMAALLQRPQADAAIDNREEVVRQLRRIRTDNVKVERLQADIEKGQGFLNITRGRLVGGDASAAFDGVVYDQNNRMRITGTFLPARTLNQLVSNIPILGLAFGRGKVNGLLGITFKLTGRYSNPKIQVNPLSIIAPGVFRNIFKF